MTTVISPSSGAGVLFTQQGVGTTPGYSALDLRRAGIGGLQEGVLGTGASAQDFMVQQRLAGANMQVEITMPAGGMAAVQGDSIGGQGLYDIPVHSANVLETIGTSDPSNPRVDQVILEVQDNVLDASGGNLARTRVLTGTPTGGANLTNRTGVAALPGSALLLADVLVSAAAGSITNSVIRDRRKWARGGLSQFTRTATNLITTSTTYGNVDGTNWNWRMECAGVPVIATLCGDIGTSATTNLFFGLVIDGGTALDREYIPDAARTSGAAIQWRFTPAAGSHTFLLQWKLTGAVTATIFAAQWPSFTVEEVIRQNSANNTVSTG